MAQWLEHRVWDAGVVGSNPTTPTKLDILKIAKALNVGVGVDDLIK